jgi:hypothetical protein
VQVIRQLAALCIKAHQQTAVSARILTAFALYSLLHVAEEAIGASPTSRLAGSVRQQLQGSGLLQHMPVMLVDAEDGLTAAAAAVVAATLIDSSAGSSADAQYAVQKLAQALSIVEELLDLYTAACTAVSLDGTYSLTAALPAAPAAVRLALTTFSTCSRLQQAGIDGLPPFSSSVLHRNPGDFAKTLATAHWAMLRLSKAVAAQCAGGSAGALEPLPGARELLLCPELVPCLAVTVLVTCLSFDTGKQAASAASSPQLSSSGRLANGISLGSLTPLSCSLFGLLGVGQGVLLQAAQAVSATIHSTRGVFNCAAAYSGVIEYQVSVARLVVVALILECNAS